ncbi:TetR/AcrR family transcriptional regulator [Micromonospora sp. NPDC000089]|uniref:TetR/AcrR family transcriptional regulator n=1 Tax=unclassified Micromonospora TaxID=2617518 RepID=UPI0036A948CE
MAAPDPATDIRDPAAGPARRPGGRSAAVRRRVLDAVTAHLIEYGYDALSVEAVADRSGVHRTTVYRRWRDVGGLLADVLAEAADDDWRPRDTGSLAGDLLAINEEVHEALTARPPLTAALIAASFRSPAAAEALRAFWVDRYDRCAVVVRRAVSRGEAPEGTDARALLVAATAPVYHEHLLLRGAPGPAVARRAAEAAVAAARAGAFTTGV